MDHRELVICVSVNYVMLLLRIFFRLFGHVIENMGVYELVYFLHFYKYSDATEEFLRK